MIVMQSTSYRNVIDESSFNLINSLMNTWITNVARCVGAGKKYTRRYKIRLKPLSYRCYNVTKQWMPSGRLIDYKHNSIQPYINYPILHNNNNTETRIKSDKVKMLLRELHLKGYLQSIIVKC